MGGADFEGPKKLSKDFTVRKYVWTVPKDVQVSVGDINVIGFVLQSYGSNAYVKFQVDMSDWKTFYNGEIVLHEPFCPLITAVPSGNSLPTNFVLNQNYPNPFNPTTTISYSVPKTSLVTIKVYDILGREVAVLVNEEKAGGNYEIKFNASNLSSGVYMYRFQAGTFIQSKKMLLLK